MIKLEVKLVDSHCHLQEMKEIQKLITEAKAEKVTKFLTNSTSLESIQECMKLAEKHKEIKAAIGIHPAKAMEMKNEQKEKAIEEMEKRAKNATAIGEIGLDYKYAKTQEEKKAQEEIFRDQVRIAVKNHKPIVVHSREAEKECLKILEEEKAKKVQMHWFTSNTETIQTATMLGYYMSCGPIILYDTKAEKNTEKIPIEKMLLETDAPVRFKGQESTPAWITKVCKKAAEIKQTSFEEIAKQTTKNFTKLYE